MVKEVKWTKYLWLSLLSFGAIFNIVYNKVNRTQHVSQRWELRRVF